MANYVLVLALGLVAGSLSGIIGTGASIILLPVLVLQYGPKQAVPIMAIAALMSNVAKMMAWWASQVDLPSTHVAIKRALTGGDVGETLNRNRGQEKASP